MQNSLIRGGEQLLDGIHWHNVVFAKTRIRYEGGEVELDNVRFIDCTFDLPAVQRAADLAEYAAVLPSQPFIIR